MSFWRECERSELVDSSKLRVESKTDQESHRRDAENAEERGAKIPHQWRDALPLIYLETM
jgi:hypothetical protein